MPSTFMIFLFLSGILVRTRCSFSFLHVECCCSHKHKNISLNVGLSFMIWSVHFAFLVTTTNQLDYIYNKDIKKKAKCVVTWSDFLEKKYHCNLIFSFSLVKLFRYPFLLFSKLGADFLFSHVFFDAHLKVEVKMLGLLPLIELSISW